MKFLAMVCCSVMMAAGATAAAADAADRGFQKSMRGQGQGLQPRWPQQPGSDQPPMPQRDMRGMRGVGAGDPGRMSPDERRQLRRDIQDAGKDIYRPVRQGPPDRRRAEPK